MVSAAVAALRRIQMAGLLTNVHRSIHALATHHDLGEPIGAILGGLWACFVLPASGSGSVDEDLRAAKCRVRKISIFNGRTQSKTQVSHGIP